MVDKAVVRERPDVLDGKTHKTRCGCGTIYITINVDEEGRPFEAFFEAKKTFECMNTVLGALGMAVSKGLRAGVPLETYRESFIDFYCPKQIGVVEGQGKPSYSCIDAIAREFAKYIKNEEDKNRRLEEYDTKPEPSLKPQSELAGIERAGELIPLPQDDEFPDWEDDDDDDEEFDVPDSPDPAHPDPSDSTPQDSPDDEYPPAPEPIFPKDPGGVEPDEDDMEVGLLCPKCETRLDDAGHIMACLECGHSEPKNPPT